jgi:hypothetical protein
VCGDHLVQADREVGVAPDLGVLAQSRDRAGLAKRELDRMEDRERRPPSG